MIDSASSTVTISAYIFQYCKAPGEGYCEGDGDYPPVAEVQISPGECPEGYKGYTFRECSEGVLGPIKTSKCTYRRPLRLSYDSEQYTLVLNTHISIAPPTYQNIITKFSLYENTFLPDGLVLDETTGAITGIPTTCM